MASQSLGSAAVSLLSDGQLDTLTLGQRDPGLLRADDENVVLACGEGVVNSVLDVDDVETTIVALTVGDDTNTAHVTTTSDHGNGASVELDVVGDLARGQVDLDRVVDLDQRIGVADAAAEDITLATGPERETYQPSVRSSTDRHNVGTIVIVVVAVLVKGGSTKA